MKRSQFTDEQIIGILRKQQVGAKAADVCRKRGISGATFYRWKGKYGGLDVSEARRLKTLEDENTKLKKLLAEAVLDNVMLKKLNSRNGDARCQATGRGSPVRNLRGEPAVTWFGVAPSTAIRWQSHQRAIASAYTTPTVPQDRFRPGYSSGPIDSYNWIMFPAHLLAMAPHPRWSGARERRRLGTDPLGKESQPPKYVKQTDPPWNISTSSRVRRFIFCAKRSIRLIS